MINLQKMRASEHVTCMLLALACLFSSLPRAASLSFSLQSAKDAGMKINEVPGMGLGAFAKEPIECFAYLGEYSGESMTLDQVQARFWGKRRKDASDQKFTESRKERGETQTGHYLFEIHDGSFVDAEDTSVSSWCRYMNHADGGTQECNCRPFTQTETDGEYHGPQFYTIRDIEVGEELRWDYGKVFWSKGKNGKAL